MAINKTHCKRGHEFTIENTRWKNHNNRICITCQKAQDKIGHDRRKYNLKPNEANELRARNCDICGIQEAVPHIDHDHITNKVRGVLCGNCNRGIGLFQNNSDLLIKAAEYLKNTNGDK